MPRYEDDEDDRPRSRRRRDEDDAEDERPSRRNRRRDEEDEYDDRPSRRSRRDDDDDDDDRPRRRSRRRPTGENAAAGISLTLGLLSILLNVITGIPAIVFGIIGLKNSRRAGTGKELALAGIGSAVVCTAISCVGIYFLWNMRSERQADNRAFDNAKQLGLALHNHHDVMNRLPVAYTTRGAFFGNQPAPMEVRLTSWRTNVLPYVEQANLFQQYDQTQSWNSARNQAVTATHVPAFSDGADKTNQTRFRVFTGPNTPFKHGVTPIRLMAFLDGTSNTAIMAESAELGPWGEPKDMEVQPFGPMPALGQPNSPFAIILMGDGSVRRIRKTVDERTLRLLVDPSDGQVVPMDW
jgi:Protein of unknown function (DUF1559)